MIGENVYGCEGGCKKRRNFVVKMFGMDGA